MVRYRGAEMEPLGNYTQTNSQIQDIFNAYYEAQGESRQQNILIYLLQP